MSDGQRYTKAVDLLGFGDPVMSATWKSGPTFMALSDRSLSLKTNYHTAWGQMEKWGNRAPRTEKCCTPSGWSHKKTLMFIQLSKYSYMSLSAFRQFLFNPGRPVQCYARCFRKLWISDITDIKSMHFLLFTFNIKSYCSSWAKAIFSAESDV